MQATLKPLKQSQHNEQWRVVLEYKGLYAVSSKGQIKSLKTNKLLSPSISKDGYLQVGLWKDGITKHHLIHYLVAVAFLPNPFNSLEVLHKDGDKMNNEARNLLWRIST